MILLVLLCLPLSFAVEITTIGEFSNCQPPSKYFEETCNFPLNSTEHQVRWAKSTGLGRSGLGYVGFTTNFTLEPLEKPQLIGILRHYNWPVTGYVPKTVDLKLNLTTGEIPLVQLFFTLDIHETPNKATPLINDTCVYSSNPDWKPDEPCCPYFTPTIPCSDRIQFITPVDLNKTFTIGETIYTLKVDGFFENGSLIDFFVTQEKEVSNGYLFGRIVQTCASTCYSADPCINGTCLGGICEFFPITGCNCLQNCTECIDQNCFWCNGVCEAQSSSTCISTCVPGDSNEDDSGKVAGIIIGSILACCCLMALLLTALLGLVCIPFLPKIKSIIYSSGVIGSKRTLQGAMENPLHEPRFEDHFNPLSE